ncbi:hypothetical protein, partial [Actinophytocola sp.]|uniref:8-oxoguanine DNA glycosylase OGG fold protein n=1 Tax=Actinophytocola sp. TaxID=1872138 RepID=UPI002ED04691
SRRLDSVAADVSRAEKLLTAAAEVSRQDPAGACAVLRPDRRNTLLSPGPSFFTKFLSIDGRSPADLRSRRDHHLAEVLQRDVQPPRRLPDHLLQYRCTNETAHDSYEWLTNREAVQPAREVRESVTDELLEPLSQCVLAGDPFVEYGIVEHRLRIRFPCPFAAHVAEQGHSMFGFRAYTASSVRSASHSAAWNGRVSCWARTAPPDRHRKALDRLLRRD